MKLILAVIAFCLSGCASYYDSQDPCQREPYPSYCGGGKLSTHRMIERFYQERFVK